MKEKLDFKTLAKVVKVQTDGDLVEVFGGEEFEISGTHPDYLGSIAKKYERMWLWDFPNYLVVTFDEGNSYCRVMLVQKKRGADELSHM